MEVEKTKAQKCIDTECQKGEYDIFKGRFQKSHPWEIFLMNHRSARAPSNVSYKPPKEVSDALKALGISELEKIFLAEKWLNVTGFDRKALEKAIVMDVLMKEEKHD